MHTVGSLNQKLIILCDDPIWRSSKVIKTFKQAGYFTEAMEVIVSMPLWSLPWCPWNVPCRNSQFPHTVGCPKCLGAIALSKQASVAFLKQYTLPWQIWGNTICNSSESIFILFPLAKYHLFASNLNFSQHIFTGTEAMTRGAWRQLPLLPLWKYQDWTGVDKYITHIVLQGHHHLYSSFHPNK